MFFVPPLFFWVTEFFLPSFFLPSFSFLFIKRPNLGTELPGFGLGLKWFFLGGFSFLFKPMPSPFAVALTANPFSFG